jgi:hypothetical protein
MLAFLEMSCCRLVCQHTRCLAIANEMFFYRPSKSVTGRVSLASKIPSRYQRSRPFETSKMAVIAEAKGSIDSLMLNKAVTQEKYDFFSSQSYMNVWEITATTLQGVSLAMSAAIALGYALS